MDRRSILKAALVGTPSTTPASAAGVPSSVATPTAPSGTVVGDHQVAIRVAGGPGEVTQQDVNDSLPRNPKLHFASPWDSTTTSAVGLQNAVLAAFKSAEGSVFLPEGNVVIEAPIELNEQGAQGHYRSSVRILGAGKGRTRLIHRARGPLLVHTLTRAQGEASHFARGLEVAHLEILGDGSTRPGATGISLQGAYYPHLHDLLISNLPSDCIVFPADPRFAGPDHYSCADAVIERCELLSSAAGYGVRNLCFSTAVKSRNNYVVSNRAGGYHLVGSNHVLDGGSCAGNGGGAPNSAGLRFLRTSDGTPQNCRVHNVEFDGNFENQIVTNGLNTHISNNRFKDTAAGGAFRAPVAIRVSALAGQSADNNLIEMNVFVLTAQGTASVTGVQFDLDSIDGRTVRYNVARANSFLASGVTSGKLIECDFGRYPDHEHARGNRHYPPAEPAGSAVAGSLPAAIPDDEFVQVVSTLGFRPSRIDFMACMGNSTSNGSCDGRTQPVNVGIHHDPIRSTWGDCGPNRCVRLTDASGTLEGYVSALHADGFSFTWSKRGSPRGTPVVKFVATR